ncbi:MAG TPA: hypothetical protein VL020_05750 [Pseudomonadales bacterium]|nr:hypothetical protein [Pseudomonadales bacterium]
MCAVLRMLNPSKQQTLNERKGSKMNNKELFKIMFNGLKTDIDYRLGEGDSLEKAKAYAREKSAAGPAIWEAIEKHYS